jgi:hypothetical protein
MTAPRACLIAVAVLAAIAPRSALAQASAPAFTAPPPSSPAAERPAAEPPAPRGESPGLINEIGKLWDKSSTMLPSWFPSGDNSAAKPPETAPPPPPTAVPPPSIAAPGRAPAALPAVAAPPPAPSTGLVPSMVSGKIQCPPAGNGAPDCKVAADLLCQSKGFATGKSLSSDSVEACSAKALIPGRERKPDDCRTNYFVTRAFCQ